MDKRYSLTKAIYAARRDNKGFTLIELLIVIVVLAILAAIVVFALGGVTGQSAVSACNSDAKSVETAISAYMANNNGSAPGSQSALTTGSPQYLRTWPNNPSYYTITMSGSNVMVTLVTGDPGVTYTGGPSTTAENYDTYTFPAGSLNTLNICAGA